MRVLHVTDCYLPRIGGIELHVRDLAAQQRRSGHEAAVVTMTPAGPDPDPAWVHRVGEGVPALPRAVESFEGLLVAHRPEVVHVHVSVLSPFATLAARAAAARGTATLVTVHSMWSGLGPLPVVARGLLGLARWPVVWSAVSDRAAEPVRELLGPATCVHVLPNAVDPDEWRTGRPTYAEEQPPGAPRTVVSVMRLTRVKRTLPLARILRQVHEAVGDRGDTGAVVIGDGPQRVALERYLHRHHLRDWVELPGRLDRSEIRERLERASVFLAPAERESFGIAPLEARALGLPVVASSRSGVGEFVRPGIHGLLASDDRGLADHVTTLLRDDGLRRSMAAHNRGEPIAHDWPAACRRALQLYAVAEELVAGRSVAAVR